MARMISRLLCVVMILGGCSSTADDAKIRTLRSGKQIEIISLDRARSTSEPTLALEYITHVQIGDQAAVQKEVEEIWIDLVKDADEAKVSMVIIEAAEGVVGGSRAFVYRRNPDGTWRKSSGFCCDKKQGEDVRASPRP